DADHQAVGDHRLAQAEQHDERDDHDQQHGDAWLPRVRAGDRAEVGGKGQCGRARRGRLRDDEQPAGEKARPVSEEDVTVFVGAAAYRMTCREPRAGEAIRHGEQRGDDERRQREPRSRLDGKPGADINARAEHGTKTEQHRARQAEHAAQSLLCRHRRVLLGPWLPGFSLMVIAGSRRYRRGMHLSYWLDSVSPPTRPPLPGDLDTDVLVIGAGIVGLTAALQLVRAGRKVVLIDMYGVGSGTTGHTTGKITVGQSLIYSRLVEQHDARTAQAYARANAEAQQWMEKLIEDEHIDCDYERKVNYIYCEDEALAPRLRRECEAAVEAGVDMTFQKDAPLPFPVAAAL